MTRLSCPFQKTKWQAHGKWLGGGGTQIPSAEVQRRQRRSIATPTRRASATSELCISSLYVLKPPYKRSETTTLFLKLIRRKGVAA